MSEQDLCQCPKCGRMHPLMGFAMPENVREQLAAELKERSSQPLPAEFLGMAKKIDALTAALTEAENAVRASVTPDAEAIRREVVVAAREIVRLNLAELKARPSEIVPLNAAKVAEVYSCVIGMLRSIDQCIATLADHPLPVQPEGWQPRDTAPDTDDEILGYSPVAGNPDQDEPASRYAVTTGSHLSHGGWVACTLWKPIVPPEPKSEEVK